MARNKQKRNVHIHQKLSCGKVAVEIAFTNVAVGNVKAVCTKPKHAKVMEYRAATGFEAVLGMLYFISDNERLDLLLKIAHGEDERTTANDTED